MLHFLLNYASCTLPDFGNSPLIKGGADSGKTNLSLKLLRCFRGEGKGLLYGLAEEDADGTTAEKLVAPFIVGNAWDGAVRRLDERARLKTEENLLRLTHETDAPIVFVSEETKQTTLDHSVDGVVTFSNGYLRRRRLKEIKSDKLRGAEHKQKRNIFTSSVPPEIIRDSNESMALTGCKDLYKTLKPLVFIRCSVTDIVTRSVTDIVTRRVTPALDISQVNMVTQS